MRPNPAYAAAALLAGTVCAPSADGAMVIQDASYFSTRPHTFLDFETRGDGTPVGLCCLEIELMAKEEYLAQGLVFGSPPVAWLHVPTPSDGPPETGNVGNAVEQIGSLRTVIAGSAFDRWSISFVEPVHAFGIGAVRNGFARNDPTLFPRIEAFAADDTLLGVLELSGDMVQGNFGGLWGGGAFGEIYQVEYGFMGLASSTPIARLEFINGGGYDNFHFSAVPAPGAGVALLMTGVMMLRRGR